MKGNEQVWDALVVGAGPAGATCALDLARRGRRVLILEKQSWPRYKTCGGGMVWRARSQLDIDIGDAIEQTANQVDLHLNDLGTTHTVVREHPLVSMGMRADVDHTLISAAQEAGALLEPESKLNRLDLRSDCLIAHTERYRLVTRYMVAADGAAGATARLAGWPAHRHTVPAIESEIQVDAATLRRFSDVARFDFGLVPAGYGWVLPKSNHLSVGCLTFQRQRPALRRRLDEYLTLLQILPTERRDHGFVIPVRPRHVMLARDRVILTGDAAGLADPVTCEGISNAISSGHLAATAIAERQPAGVEDIYQQSLRTSILAELRFARVFSGLIYRTPRLRAFVFRRLGQALSEAMADIISGDLTYRSLLTSPSRNLRAALQLVRHTR